MLRVCRQRIASAAAALVAALSLSMANAQSVSDSTPPRIGVRRSRCLIRASGYYEWQDTGV
jgi:putative SOS response-associated peptidase YedK